MCWLSLKKTINRPIAVSVPISLESVETTIFCFFCFFFSRKTDHIVYIECLVNLCRVGGTYSPTSAAVLPLAGMPPMVISGLHLPTVKTKNKQKSGLCLLCASPLVKTLYLSPHRVPYCWDILPVIKLT